MIDTLLQDLKFGWRVLRRDPGYALAAMLSLALGIGAATAMFSVVRGVVLRPLPYQEPERLVVVLAETPPAIGSTTAMSHDDYRDLRSTAASFEELAAVTPQWSFIIGGRVEPQRAHGFYASGNFFRMLGVAPAHGRLLSDDDDRAGAPAVAVLSWDFWRRRCGGDPGAVGRPIIVDGDPVMVAGVLPPAMRWTEEADLWLPLARNPYLERGRSVRFLTVSGRLARGAGLDGAAAELGALAAGLAACHPETNAGVGARLRRLHDHVVGDIAPALGILWGATGLLLLIACANAAALLVGRAAVREREYGIRAALGAGRGRLLRQLLTESLLLALVAGGAGLLLASWAVEALVALAPGTIPRRQEIGIDPVVALFAFAAAVVTGLLFGLAPAWRVRDAVPVGPTGGGAAGGRVAGPGGRRLRKGLVVVEVALSLVLLVGSALLVRSLSRLMVVDPGFRVAQVLSFTLPLPSPAYDDAAARRDVTQRVLAGLEALPGVLAAGVVTRLPLAGASNPTTEMDIEGHPVGSGQRPHVDFRRASQDYFAAMGIPLLAGRGFAAADGADAPLVALVNRTAARRFWGDTDPIGRRVRLGPGPDEAWTEVVGIVGDIHHEGLAAGPRPEVYVHTLQYPPSWPIVVVRAAAEPTAVESAARRVVQAIDPAIPLADVATLQDVRLRSVAGPRYWTLLMVVFGVLAVALALIGVYGVITSSVTERTVEIGVRMALGAGRLDILAMVACEALRLAAVGLGAGLVAALLATRLLRRLIFGVGPHDPVTFALSVAGLLVVAAAAAALPALRAARVDPAMALRRS